MKLEAILFNAGEGGLFLSVLASLLAVLVQRMKGKWTRTVQWAAVAVSCAAFALITALVVARAVRTGHSPFANMYEFSIVFVWGILLMNTVFLWKYRNFVINLAGFAAAALLMLYAGSLSMDVTPLVPALQNSVLLTLHVLAAVIAYGAFTIGFIASVLLLMQKNDRFSSLPAASKLENIGYHSVIIGFPSMSLVIVLGAVWADIAWGSFWSWDPKETASLVTWLLYAGYLHLRLLRKWRGRKSAVLLIVGFAAVLFTFFGNYLFGGLHTYV